MNNRDLFLKINDDLNKNYLVGLHNTTKDAYILKSMFDVDKYCMNIDNVDEEDIVNSILNNGLYVSNRCVGLKSTVFFPNKINVDIFNYLHIKKFNINMNKIYVIVVAIPKYIYLNGKKYFLRNKLEYVDMASYSLFDILLPKEFIYGYYVKNISYKECCIYDDNFINNIIFDEGLEFYQNDCFYKFMSKEEQEEFWINYFKDNNIDVSLLFNDKHYSTVNLSKRKIRKKSF